MLRRGKSRHTLRQPAERLSDTCFTFRPSVMIGDLIKVITVHGKVHGGFVHVVEGLEVGLHFHTSFRQTRGETYDVDFSLCRLPLRRMHQALNQLNWNISLAPRLLFPAINIVPSARLPSTEQFRMSLFNLRIQENHPQLQAVASIVSQPLGSVPFVVFGP